MPADENPTEILEFDDEFDDDLYDEDDYDDEFDPADDDTDDEDRAVPEYFSDERDDELDDSRRTGRGRRLIKWVAALVLLAVLAVGAYFGARELLGFGYDDYEGKGERDVVLHVEDGDITSAIAAKLVELDVVASTDAFIKAGEEDERVLGVQPGYYRLKTRMSGESAVSALVAEGSRIGHIQIRAGTQLEDVIQPDESVTDGIYTLLANASCAPVEGESTCVSADDLRETVSTAKLSDLGVPEWVARSAAKAKGSRKIEGLILPGVYDIQPGSSAEEVLTEVLSTSATRLEAAGLPKLADDTPFSAYELLVVSSIIEKEAVKSDFTKVSSVIHNRTEIDMKLEMDSTVNYLLKRPELTTDAKDRAKHGPYNTYETVGLPPTPIAAPSEEAIAAAAEPADTDFVYFVKCEKNGLSCFTSDYEEHLANRDDARARDVY